MKSTALPSHPERPLTGRPAGRGLRIVIILLSLLALSLIVATGAFEWITQQTSGGRREESDLGIALAFLLIAIIGALAAMAQPRNVVGWLLLFSGLTIGMAGAGESLAYYLQTARQDEDAALIVIWLASMGWITGIVLLLLVFPLFFPDGHLPGPRWRPVFVLVLLFTAAILSVQFLAPLFSRRYFDPNELDALLGYLLPVFPILALMGAASLVVRYRRADFGARQQMKWLSVTIGVPVMGFFGLSMAEDWFGILAPNTLWGVLYLMIPFGLGISLLRYNLFDVDTVIRKTAQYAIVTVLLALIYFGAVILLQRAFSDVTGQTSTAAVMLSTLAIAALFNPVRRRVQAFIDRRFYRRKYDAEQVLARFATTARDETDLDTLAAELVQVIQETMQPEYVSIWLKETNARTPGRQGTIET